MKLYIGIKTTLFVFTLSMMLLPFAVQARDSLAALRADMDAIVMDQQSQINALGIQAGVITYKIGDTGPAGGIVFHVTDNGKHGLEAAPTDQSDENGVPWNNGSSFPETSAGKAGITDGSFNTDLIIISQGYQNTISGYAAILCANYNGGGYGDWYLPSKDELNLINNNLYNTGLASFADDPYWSSTEANSISAWGQLFVSGYQTNYYKANKRRVRAIRNF